MGAKVLTFFNNKGGVGKTSLIYHLAWISAQSGKRIVVADLDPQANLTAAFLEEDIIEQIWNDQKQGSTIYNCVKPLARVGDITEPVLQKVADNLYLIPGDVQLSGYEDSLSGEWPNSMQGQNLYRPMRVLSSFWQVMQMAAQQVTADIVLVDVGPNLGAINRSVLIATDYLVIPLGADLFSLQGLRNLGPTLRNWNSDWNDRLINWEKKHETGDSLQLPNGKMQPLGYVCQQPGIRLDRPVQAYEKWVNRIPEVYRQAVLNERSPIGMTPYKDPECLAIIKHYRSLVPMAQEHRKPIFNLTSADGAIGGHANAVSSSRKDFKELADKIFEKIR